MGNGAEDADAVWEAGFAAMDAAANAAGRAVQDAIAECVDRDFGGPAPYSAVVAAIMVGSVVAVGNAASALAGRLPMAKFEAALLAHLRGLEGPIHEDGRPFEGAARA